MDFKKKLDYKDINIFLPDNLTIGTTEYFNEKFNGMMPNYVCEYLELKSREENNNEKHNEEMLNIIKEKAIQDNLKIIQEYEERLNEAPQEEEQQTTFYAPFLSLEEDINKLDLGDRKGTENVVCCLDELEITENISSER